MRRIAYFLLPTCMVLAMPVQGAFHGRDIFRAPDMANMDMVDTVSWYSEESVRLAVEPWRAGRRMAIPEGATAAWVVCDEGGTNWIVRYDSTPTTNCTFWLGSGEGALPAGHDYAGYVSLLDGTNILGVVDRHNVRVLGQASDGGSEISPEGGAWGGILQRMAAAEAAIATNAAAIAGQETRLETVEGDMADLRGELQGPAWLTPERFSWEAESVTTVTTNIGAETDSGWAVLTRPRMVVRESGYTVRPVVERNQWDAELDVAVTGPATLAAIGDGSFTLSWHLGTETGSTATVSGQLGDWRSSKVLTMQSAGSVQTQHWFSSFASGGVREDLAGVMAVWTNMSGNIDRFTNFSSGKTSTVETLSLEVNTNFWARNCDLSGVSVWNDNGGYYYTKPGTLIASNLCYGAAHWSVAVGKTLAWYGKDGQIHASKVVDQRRMNGDLCVSKLSPPLDTNSVTAYPILDLTDIDRKIRAGDGMVYALPPMPVLAMSQAERGWIMESGISGGGTGGIWDSNARAYIRNSRIGAVGGDSGHPVFVSTDATNLILLGCYWRPTGLSLPGGDKVLVLSAVEAMGADTNAVSWEAWTNYPTYMGPLPTPN